MAAGLGFKTFATGDVLTAGDTNGYLMQGVWVFADAAARSAAVTSPVEGNMSYLSDTDSTEYYSGSAWVAIGGAGSPLTTKGDLFTFDTADARLGVGTDGQFLVADSTASTGLAWLTAGGSPIKQIVYAQNNTGVGVASTTYVDTGLTATITPTSASSDIIIFYFVPTIYAVSGKNSADMNYRLLRGATAINTVLRNSFVQSSPSQTTERIFPLSNMWKDSPATTSATTYKTQIARGVSNEGETWSINTGGTYSTMLLVEV